MLKTFKHRLKKLFMEEDLYQGASMSLETFRAYHLCYSLKDSLPYESYEEGIYFNRTTLGFVLESLPIMGFSEESHKQISGLFQYLLPENSNIQFLLMADPYIGGALEEWQKVRDHASSILSKVAFYRTQAFKELASCEGKALSARFFRLILSVTLPYEKQASKPLAQAVGEMKELKERLQETLKMVGLHCLNLAPASLISLIDDFFFANLKEQGFKPFVPDYNPYDPIRFQTPTRNTSLQVTKKGLIINENQQYFRSYQVAKYPLQWDQFHMGELIGSSMQLLQQLPFPFFIHYGIHIPAQTEIQFKFTTKASHLERQLISPIAKYLPTMGKEWQEYQFVKRQLAEGHRFVKTHMSIAFVAPPHQVNRYEQMLLNLYLSKGFQLREDDFFHLQSFLTLLPMSFSDSYLKDLASSKKLKTTISSESANLLPIQGEWYGTQSPGMLLLGRRGQITFWSPFDNNSGNYNVSVVGRSGSGKSVFMQELMTSTLGQGGRVFVLDVGRSFEKTCLLLEGQFIEFTPKTPLCLNPFSSLKGQTREEVEDSLSMLKSILCTMAAPNLGVDDLEASYLEQAMRESWRQYQEKTTLTKIAQRLLENKDKKANGLGIMLYPYTKTGIYGRFFEGEANVDFQKSLVVLELEELKERKDLQAVIVQMVVVHITNQMFLGDRQTPFMIVFDEAWDMLRGSKSGVFVETLARRLRKYNGSLVVGTQSVNDFYQSPGAQAAYENSDWLCLLSQKPESINMLKENKRVNMNAYMEETLKSVHTQGGDYAECMIYGPHGYAVTRLVLDPFSKVLYSTKASEYSAVKRLVDQGWTMEAAVEKMAEITPSFQDKREAS